MVGASDISIANQAIGWVGGNLIISFDQDQTEAKLAKANYAPLRQALLESADWSFAMSRFIPPQLSAPPAWGYQFQFQLPPNVLRVVYCGQSGRAEEGDPVDDWVREGETILAQQAQIFVRAIVDVVDPGRFSPLFSQALAARIATDLAIPIANSRSLQADMMGLFGRKMAEAVAQDNKQGRTRRLRAPGMQLARQAGATGFIGPTV